jgi:hypothetical protein
MTGPIDVGLHSVPLDKLWERIKRAPRIKAEPRRFDPRAIRLAELCRLIRHRHGDTLPDSKLGRSTIFVLCNHLAMLPGKQHDRVAARVEELAPWMPEDEATGIITAITSKPRRYKAQTIGNVLGLTWAEKIVLGITTIRATDEPTKAEKQRIRQERKRRKAGATPRSACAERNKPWVVLGISRATYYRHRETNSSRAYTSLRGRDETVSNEFSDRQGPNVDCGGVFTNRIPVYIAKGRAPSAGVGSVRTSVMEVRP